MKHVVKERHEKAAIIGYWRCGAGVREICAITGLSEIYIYETIGEYINRKGVENHEDECE